MLARVMVAATARRLTMVPNVGIRSLVHIMTALSSVLRLQNPHRAKLLSL